MILNVGYGGAYCAADVPPGHKKEVLEHDSQAAW